MVESLGVSIFRARLMAFVIAALLAATSGWLYAHRCASSARRRSTCGRAFDYLLMAMAGGSGYVGRRHLGRRW